MKDLTQIKAELEQIGIRNVGNVLWNARTPQLYEEVVRRQEGNIAQPQHEAAPRTRERPQTIEYPRDRGEASRGARQKREHQEKHGRDKEVAGNGREVRDRGGKSAGKGKRQAGALRRARRTGKKEAGMGCKSIPASFVGDITGFRAFGPRRAWRGCGCLRELQ